MVESRSNKGQHNTGWAFDLVDEEKAEEGHFMAQMGNYDTRHEAIGMKAIFERMYPELDYEVRAFETMYGEQEEPVVCSYCGFEDWYSPQVGWYYYPNGPFCTEECMARWHWENDREQLREIVNHD